MAMMTEPDPPTDQPTVPGAAAVFEEDTRGDAPSLVAGLVLDIEGYAGPIDVLLALARDQKVDLMQVSILQLAEQYLAFVDEAKRRNLELAADYLVMAAWLAFLKSRLLVPDMSAEDEPSGEEMAAALQYQLQRLQAMQDAGKALMDGNLLGRDVFARGAPEVFKDTEIAVVDATLHDLLVAYGNLQRPRKVKSFTIEPSFELHSAEDAAKRLRRMLGVSIDWQSIWRFLPTDHLTPLGRRSAIAATLQATLELAKTGAVEMRQDGTFGQIYLRGTDRLNDPDARADSEIDAEGDSIAPERSDGSIPPERSGDDTTEDPQ